jgi:hypothetical protein
VRRAATTAAESQKAPWGLLDRTQFAARPGPLRFRPTLKSASSEASTGCFQTVLMSDLRLLSMESLFLASVSGLLTIKSLAQKSSDRILPPAPSRHGYRRRAASNHPPRGVSPPGRGGIRVTSAHGSPPLRGGCSCRRVSAPVGVECGEAGALDCMHRSTLRLRSSYI